MGLSINMVWPVVGRVRGGRRERNGNAHDRAQNGRVTRDGTPERKKMSETSAERKIIACFDLKLTCTYLEGVDQSLCSVDPTKRLPVLPQFDLPPRFFCQPPRFCPNPNLPPRPDDPLPLRFELCCPAPRGLNPFPVDLPKRRPPRLAAEIAAARAFSVCCFSGSLYGIPEKRRIICIVELCKVRIVIRKE